MKLDTPAYEGPWTPPDLRNWRNVAMPAAVAALPLDKRGFPVPWVSEWKADNDDLLPGFITDVEPFVGQLTGFDTCEIGRGVPDLGAICPVRQRQGFFDALCGVCGDPLDETCFFMGGADNLTFSELPCHRECALYAGQVCPGLVTSAREVGVVECVTGGWDYPVAKYVVREGSEVTARTDNGPYGDAALVLLHARPVEVVRRSPLAEWVHDQLALTP